MPSGWDLGLGRFMRKELGAAVVDFARTSDTANVIKPQ